MYNEGPRRSNETPGGGAVGGGLLLGGLQLAGGLYDSHQNRKTAKENTDKTIKANRAAAELAYQREVEMWHMQNLYNSPEAQMQRFKDAGLNPHLVMGGGNAGNASSFPHYQPPRYQYEYEAGKYGAAVTGVLPTLMAVGTWMQNMRLSEAELRSKQITQEKGVAETERVRQLMEYLEQANPELLRKLHSSANLEFYQEDIKKTQRVQADVLLEEMRQKFRSEYGEDLFRSLPGKLGSSEEAIGGTKRLEFLKKESEARIAEAKASWLDMNITDPQAIMMLVLQGVMGMAGAQLRLSTHKGKGAKEGPKMSTHQQNRKAFENSTKGIHKGMFD